MNIRALLRPLTWSVSAVLYVTAFALAVHVLAVYGRVAWLDHGVTLLWLLVGVAAFVKCALAPWYYLDGAEKWANQSVPWREVLTKLGQLAGTLAYHGAVLWLVWWRVA